MTNLDWMRFPQVGNDPYRMELTFALDLKAYIEYVLDQPTCKVHPDPMDATTVY